MNKLLYFLPFLALFGCGLSAAEIESKVRAELKKQQDSLSLLQNNTAELPSKYGGEWTSHCILDIDYRINIQNKENKFYFDIRWGNGIESRAEIIKSNGSIEADKILNNNDGSYSCYFTIAGKPVAFKLYYEESSVIYVTMLLPQKESSSVVLFNCSTIENQDDFFKLEEKYSTEIPNKSSQDGLYPFASKALLKVSDLNSFTKQDLKIMRNEIYARHGYIFKTAEMKTYFSRQSWYKGQYDDVTSMFSSIEKQNIELIKKYE